jgi:hypothetical protein
MKKEKSTTSNYPSSCSGKLKYFEGLRKRAFGILAQCFVSSLRRQGSPHNMLATDYFYKAIPPRSLPAQG